jgi:A/G-specific adenine glycosylase
VASFAFEKAVPAVDTNVSRVIRRVFIGVDRERLTRQRSTRQRSTRQRLIWSIASSLVPKNGKRAWKFNQAVMELGALVCVAKKPKCPECPVRPICRTGKD